MKRVVVLTDYSLLAQGLVSRLRQSSQSLEMVVLDFCQPDLLEELVRQQPQVVIYGSQNVEMSNHCPLGRLFDLLPNLMVIEVNLEKSNIQLIRGGEYKSAGFPELVNILEDVSGRFSETVPAVR
jgi:hypothetical protein